MYLSDMNGSKDDLSFWGNLLEVTSWWLENTQCLGLAALFCVVFLYDKHEAHLFERPVWHHTGHSKRIKPHITYIRYLFFPTHSTIHIAYESYTPWLFVTLSLRRHRNGNLKLLRPTLGCTLGSTWGPQGFGAERKPNLTEPKLSQICRNNFSP